MPFLERKKIEGIPIVIGVTFNRKDTLCCIGMVFTDECLGQLEMVNTRGL